MFGLWLQLTYINILDHVIVKYLYYKKQAAGMVDDI